MPTSKRVKYSNVATPDFSLEPSKMTVGDLIIFQWKGGGGNTIRGRVLRLVNLPQPGCVVGPLNDDNVRIMALSVACYNDDGYVIERNGHALFEV